MQADKCFKNLCFVFWSLSLQQILPYYSLDGSTAQTERYFKAGDTHSVIVGFRIINDSFENQQNKFHAF